MKQLDVRRDRLSALKRLNRVNGAAQAVPANTRWPGLTTSTAALADRSLFESCSRDDPKPRISAYFTAVSLNWATSYCVVVSRSYLSVGFLGRKYRVNDAPRYVRYGSEADIPRRPRHVCFTLIAAIQGMSWHGRLVP